MEKGIDYNTLLNKSIASFLKDAVKVIYRNPNVGKRTWDLIHFSCRGRTADETGYFGDYP